ncbi:MAG: hypothetical protein K9K78_04215 [Spirochaetales bacterium]|nr:hypothetical protein [Spirochaetales bacterium]
MRFKPQYRIVIIYLIFGLLWIYFSDMLIEFIDTSLSIRVLQNIKGFIFILTTALLLFFLIRGDVRKLERANREVIRSYEQSMRRWAERILSIERMLSFQDRFLRNP